MSFVKLLINEKVDSKNTAVPGVLQESRDTSVLQEAEKPEAILRRANFKIKLVTPTFFGTQIDFAKKYNEEDITAMLKGFKITIKGKSVFIED